MSRLRAGDVTTVAVGSGRFVIYSRESGAIRLVSPAIAATLVAADHFKRLEEHAAAIAPTLGAHPDVVRRELELLVEQGFLTAAPRPSSRETDVAPIRALAIPTCDRPGRLMRTLVSYHDNGAAHGRTLEVLVADDTAGSSGQHALVSRLQGLRAPVRYAGRAEKARWARLLAESAGVQTEVAEFACCGDLSAHDTLVGANRNCILLDSVGELCAMADDDVACRVARPVGALDRPVRLSSAGAPLDVAFFSDPDVARDATVQTDEDVLALHEEWLGRPVLGCLTELVDADDATPSTLRQLARGDAHIAASLIGIVGDCAWDDAAFGLFVRGGEGRARSREAVQAVARPTLTDRGDPLFGWCLGLDARTLLPPFAPLGRAEDVTFGVLLSRCFPDRYVAHIPRVLSHEPDGVRGFSSESPFAVGFNGWLPSVLTSLPVTGGPPERSLAELGAQLRDLGHASPAGFTDFARRHLLESLATRTELLEEGMPNASAAWRRDATDEIRRMRDAAVVPDAQLFTQAGGREGLQSRLVRFGDVLDAWPLLWSAAGDLRARGQRMGRTVAPRG